MASRGVFVIFRTSLSRSLWYSLVGVNNQILELESWSDGTGLFSFCKLGNHAQSYRALQSQRKNTTYCSQQWVSGPLPSRLRLHCSFLADKSLHRSHGIFAHCKGFGEVFDRAFIVGTGQQPGSWDSEYVFLRGHPKMFPKFCWTCTL